MSRILNSNNNIERKLEQGKKDEKTFANILTRHGMDPKVKWMYTDELFTKLGLSKREAYKTPDLTFYEEIDGEIQPIMFIEVEHADKYSSQVAFHLNLTGKLVECGFVSPHFFIPRGKYYLTNGNSVGHSHLYLHKRNYFDIKETFDFEKNVNKLFDMDKAHTFYARISLDWSHVFFVKAEDFLDLIPDPNNICTGHGKKPFVLHSRKDTFFSFCPKRVFEKVDMDRYIASNYLDNYFPNWKYVLEYLSLETRCDLRDITKDGGIYRDIINYYRDKIVLLSEEDIITETLEYGYTSLTIKEWLDKSWKKINLMMEKTKEERQKIARDNLNFLRKRKYKSRNFY